jgi:hypothetical protein
MPISANKAKIVRKRAKRAKDGPLFHKTIDSACERWLRSRGLVTRKFTGWESRHPTEEPGTAQNDPDQ